MPVHAVRIPLVGSPCPSQPRMSGMPRSIVAGQAKAIAYDVRGTRFAFFDRQRRDTKTSCAAALASVTPMTSGPITMIDQNGFDAPIETIATKPSTPHQDVLGGGAST